MLPNFSNARDDCVLQAGRFLVAREFLLVGSDALELKHVDAGHRRVHFLEGAGFYQRMDAFAAADQTLRAALDVLQDKRALERLAEIESAEGRKERYHIEALMIRAKRVMRTESAAPPDLAKITEAVSDYEAMVKATEEFAAANKGSTR